MRTIWSERNWRTFEDVSKTVHQLTDCFAALLCECSSALGFTTYNYVLEFVTSLGLVWSLDYNPAFCSQNQKMVGLTVCVFVW
jgi:hypothetical protein